MKVRGLQLVPKPPTESDDSLALRRVASGEVGALGEVYDRHADALLRFAARAAGSNDAEDLVQATFVTVVKVAGTYDGRSDNARSWLFGVLVRLMHERRRSFARFTRAVLRLRTRPTEEGSHDDGHRTDLARGLARLSDSKRVVILLAEVEGYTCDEIAAMLSIPVGTVWTRLHHARKELRGFYEEGAS